MPGVEKLNPYKAGAKAPQVEAMFDHIASAYSMDPAESKALIYEQIQKNFPEAAQEELEQQQEEEERSNSGNNFFWPFGDLSPWFY